MRCTFILKDFSDAFYAGTESGSVVGLFNMPDEDKFRRLCRMADEKRVTRKIGSGQFRDAVDLNAMLRDPCTFKFSLEPRRGYRLASFEIVRAD